MEQETQMTHRVFVDDTVVIRRSIEVPEACPRCKSPFDLGREVFKGMTMRPRVEKLVLSTVIDEKTKRHVVSVKDVSPYGTWPRLILDIKCNHCDHVLLVAHSRTYELDGMAPSYAAKLQGLLYDSNARDPVVQRVVFKSDAPKHPTCRMCDIEAEIGTEEVPHPIDGRLHTCEKIPP